MYFSPETIEAERLLKEGQRKAAQARLAQAVTRNANNAHAWRLLAEALDDPAQKRYALGRAESLEAAEQAATRPIPAQPRLADPRPTRVEAISPSLPTKPEPRVSLWDPQPTEPDAAPPSPQSSAPRSLTPLEMVQQRAHQEAADAETRRKNQRGAQRGWILGGAAFLTLVVLVGVAGVAFLLRTQPTTPHVAVANATRTPVVTAGPTLTPLPYTAVFVEGRCPFQPPANAAVSCGTVTVPQDRSQPTGASVTLAVVVYRSARSNVNTPPLFYLQGGPGADAISWSASAHASVVAPIAAERDLVVFDQRGTGFSTPKLECPELYAGEPVAAATACRDLLAGAGIDLADYTTAANAADVRDIARALGYGRIDLYGISYGTRLAMTIMRDDPTLVRSAVLDSALPPEVQLVNDTAANADHALDQLFAVCAADPVCSATYPDLAATFDRLLEQAAAAPIEVPAPNTLGGAAEKLALGPAGIISAAMWGMHIADYIPAVPYAIDALQKGNVTSLNPLAAIFSTTAPDMSSVVYQAITCHEQILPSTDAAINASFDAHPRTASFGRLYVFGDAATGRAACEALGVVAASQAELAPLQTDKPSLVLAGGLDPTTPAAYGEQAAAASTHSTYVLWPTAGHAVSAGPDARCAQSVISQFLTDPAVAPDASCVQVTETRAFLAPGDLAVASAPAASAPAAPAPAPSDGEPTTGGGSGPGEAAAPSDGGGSSSSDDGGPHWNSGETKYGLLGVSVDECLVCLSHFLGLEPGQLYYDSAMETDGQLWFLYRADDYKGRIVDIAVAAVPDGTLFVVMLTDPDNRGMYYGSSYLPTIEGVTSEYWAPYDAIEPTT